jgi:hypothetical protein
LSQYREPLKPSTAEYIAGGAAAALPLIGRLVGGKAGRTMRDIGGLPAGFLGGSRKAREANRERTFKTGMAELGGRRERYGTRFDVMSGLAEDEALGIQQDIAGQKEGLRFEKSMLPGTPSTAADRLAFDREQFVYEKEQNKLARDRQLALDYQKYGVGPFPEGLPTGQQYPEGYVKAATKLIQDISVDRRYADNVQKQDAIKAGLKQLMQLYGIDEGGGPEALLEQLRREQGPLENLR